MQLATAKAANQFTQAVLKGVTSARQRGALVPLRQIANPHGVSTANIVIKPLTYFACLRFNARPARPIMSRRPLVGSGTGVIGLRVPMSVELVRVFLSLPASIASS